MEVTFSPEQIDFEKSGGIVPAIIQDSSTYQVLMLGYMNKEALHHTIDNGQITFYSRSKERLWTKGESSGNHLHVVSIQQDCDNDALLIQANPAGPACHTGETSCFHQLAFKPSEESHFLHKLEELLIDRKQQLPEGSYTSKLFQKGSDKIAQKVGEEAIETVIAAKNDNPELIYEASDLLFHLLMLLVDRGVELNDLIGELEKRHKPD